MDLQGLTVKDMEELQEDIKMHLDLDRATPTHIQYWEVISVLYAGYISKRNTLLFMNLFLYCKISCYFFILINMTYILFSYFSEMSLGKVSLYCPRAKVIILMLSKCITYIKTYLSLGNKILVWF